MKERLLIDLVGDCHEQVIMVGRVRTDECKERSHARLIQAIHGLFCRRIILEQLLENSLIFNVEDLVLESKEKLRSFINGDLVLQKLK
jgi:hypothetical protein